VCGRNRIAWLVAVAVIQSAPGFSVADVITLKSGGAVRGTIVARSPVDLAVRTQTDALIVVELDAIQQIGLASSAAVPKHTFARKSAMGSAHSGRRRPTAQEQAWLGRVRSLAGRLFSDDDARSRQARGELLAIVDPAALPAVCRYLQSAPSMGARQLFVAVVRQIPGDESTGLLVMQSLGDPSPGVRAEARKAIGPERAAAARRMYIECLRSGSPGYSGVAAQGLAEIGDPQVDSVPYLIEALVEHTTQELYEPARPPRFSECMDEMVEASQPNFFTVPRTEGRQDVLDALLKITEQPYPKFGYNLEQWREWWASVRCKRRETSR
jgi:hypothetical protein